MGSIGQFSCFSGLRLGKCEVFSQFFTSTEIALGNRKVSGVKLTEANAAKFKGYQFLLTGTVLVLN